MLKTEIERNQDEYRADVEKKSLEKKKSSNELMCGNMQKVEDKQELSPSSQRLLKECNRKEVRKVTEKSAETHQKGSVDEQKQNLEPVRNAQFEKFDMEVLRQGPEKLKDYLVERAKKMDHVGGCVYLDWMKKTIERQCSNLNWLKDEEQKEIAGKFIEALHAVQEERNKEELATELCIEEETGCEKMCENGLEGKKHIRRRKRKPALGKKDV